MKEEISILAQFGNKGIIVTELNQNQVFLFLYKSLLYNNLVCVK